MPSFSPLSLERLATCHPELQRLFLEVVKTHDCTVLVGWRSEAAQAEAFNTGKSLDPWPKSLHNALPSLAVDVMPWPLNWDDEVGILAFSEEVKATASRLGITIRYGGDFTRLSDRDHYELVNPLSS